MNLTEQQLVNYIEVELNKGRSLSDIRAELIRKKIPVDVAERVLSTVYKDEMDTLKNTTVDEEPRDKGFWERYAELLFGIAAIILILIVVYMFIFR